MRRIFICHPLSGDIKGNMEQCRKIAKRVQKLGDYQPIVPQLIYPQFMDDTDPVQRKLALKYCLNDLRTCDEMWVFGDVISKGMQGEIDYARNRRIPTKYFEQYTVH